MLWRRILGCMLAAAVLAGAGFLALRRDTATRPLAACASTAEAGLVLQEQADGLYVLALSPRGAAARAGIRSGDTLLSLDGVPLRSREDFSGLMQAKGGGRLSLSRRGEQRELSLGTDLKSGDGNSIINAEEDGREQKDEAAGGG